MGARAFYTRGEENDERPMTNDQGKGEKRACPGATPLCAGSRIEDAVGTIITQRALIADPPGISVPIRRLDAWLIGFLLAGLAALHVVYAFIFRVDSDESQHLHVVWGWTQGQLYSTGIFSIITRRFSAGFARRCSRL